MTETLVATRHRPAVAEISWLDRFRIWVESLPVPAAIVYLVIWALALTYTMGVPLAFGGTPFVGLQVVTATLPVYFLAANHLLVDSARKALQRFSPLLAVDDARLAEIERILTTLPLRDTRRLSVVGVAIAVPNVFLAGALYPADLLRLLGLDRPSYIVYSVLPVLVIWALLLPLLYRTLRALRTVVGLHASARVIDPLRPGPVSAFSEFTLRVAVVYILVPLITFAIASEVFALAGASIIPMLGFNLIGVAIFLVPLLGLHARLEDVRSAELDKVTGGLERVVDELARRSRELELADIDPLVKSIGSLIAAREMLLKAQTWPWRPGTFNLFVSLFGAPIVLFVLTRFLGRLL